jgi:hypothetical protein
MTSERRQSIIHRTKIEHYPHITNNISTTISTTLSITRSTTSPAMSLILTLLILTLTTQVQKVISIIPQNFYDQRIYMHPLYLTTYIRYTRLKCKDRAFETLFEQLNKEYARIDAHITNISQQNKTKIPHTDRVMNHLEQVLLMQQLLI